MLMNFASNSLPNLGSGRISRLATTRLLGILIFLCVLQVIPALCPDLTHISKGMSSILNIILN
jgi:hypothetical protein